MRIGFTLLHVVLAALAWQAPGAQAQTNGIAGGATKVAYYDCRAPGDMPGIAAIAAFGEDINTKTFGINGDAINQYNLDCAQALHRNRCAKEIITALGEAHMAVMSAALGASLPDIPGSTHDPIAVGAGLGAAAGLGIGVLTGRPISGTVKGALAGAGAGAVYGWAAPLAKCQFYKSKLEKIAAKMQTPASALLAPLPISATNAQLLLDENVAARHITLEEAGLLRAEIGLLSGRLREIVAVITQ